MAGSIIQHIPETFNYFITIPHEKLVLAERKHWIIIVDEIITVLFLDISFSAISYFLLRYYFHYPQVFISLLLVVFCATISLIVKIIVDWYFHLFIVTNKKILEVRYSPLFFYKINGVLLDQVRCTEIDEKKHGILNEILDMGDIVITFDRPTHQEEFIFMHIKNPRKVAMILSDLFGNIDSQNSSQTIWYKVQQKTNLLPLNRQSFGRYSLGGR